MRRGNIHAPFEGKMRQEAGVVAFSVKSLDCGCDALNTWQQKQ